MIRPRPVEGEVRGIGHRWSPRVHAIKELLARSGVPFRWPEVEGDGAAVGAAEGVRGMRVRTGWPLEREPYERRRARRASSSPATCAGDR